VLAFLLLALIIAVPGFLASSRASNHRNACASLKTIPSAEADFRANDRDDNKVNDFWVGDVSRLYYLEVQGRPIKLIERSVADADGSPKEPLKDPSSKAGFRFAAIKLDETGAPYDRGGGPQPGEARVLRVSGDLSGEDGLVSKLGGRVPVHLHRERGQRHLEEGPGRGARHEVAQGSPGRGLDQARLGSEVPPGNGQ
jgi:hypothetical protein